ncbi:phosphoribosylformimino-5-aminoimidazole carboxamide ribotide isomerase [Paenibacillus darwinianus]|uniref:Phosphoribosylformimino-5-aminoimidazole carboxamide ribotide isomerase n=1 Tax=Paenibacillus darwinianus TaxID=1380763 RepID=A0A9W5S2K7_9BACL|nr:phosphoribosylformimino-5-aminoimidazole carboxamide ribotide isomerase [Paenibacillus darwinianus]EXX90305.1 phosphoribosylformimino-5-aminoimidazole carboxamide ribotide isomerase [Paenibacillus darwinianus]EXX90956.1 phosphoribosylformimino-5-aminoimidazole carboxamide ribotide isomerase [Paenibacillus darwinianus]EXX90968.1 phosphoribosylformimino-5-aminoimidazole carboxamide ribotide isomerase [Paenibacillus darwinianus]
MRFRPCIDIHQGKVKQIVGETLNASGQGVVENFVSEHDPAYFANLFQQDGLTGGHVIMLGAGNEAAAEQALRAYPGGLQIGGGIRADNAEKFLEMGASHVIVTSYVFQDGRLQTENLNRIVEAVGRERLVIDLSCKKRDGKWYVVTNQWTTFSDFELHAENIHNLEAYCDEFLVHAVDVEGKRTGVLEELAERLADWTTIPTTYAGGARSLEDLEVFRRLTDGRLDITVGSALDIFGGVLPYRGVVAFCEKDES